MNIITENPKTSFNLSKAASDRIKVLLKDEKVPTLEYPS